LILPESLSFDAEAPICGSGARRMTRGRTTEQAMTQNLPLPPGAAAPPPSDIIYPSALPFALVHLACFGAIWTGVEWKAAAIGVSLYWLRIFAIGAGYHRYFSHRAYETSRPFQFVLAALSQSTAQKSVLWWAAKHRHHHLHSDTPLDVHSPLQRGFLYSHFGWIFDRHHEETDLVKVADFAKYPELMWLHRHELAPAVVLAILCFSAAGLQGLVVGFFWSTVAVYHATFSINSVAHVAGRRRYVTGDDSRNNWLLAIFTMGEGWHNNHHAFQSSVRQGFRWWEYDPTFYLLKLLSFTRLIWSLKSPPIEVLENRRPLGSRVIRRAADQVAARFNSERIAGAVASVLGAGRLAQLHAQLAHARQCAADVLSEMNLPQVPAESEIRKCARSMLANSPSLEDIAAKAHRIVLEAVGARLATLAAQAAGAE
jgi:stearoyl-CoA desaturase (delta-9 desaturase)